MAEESLIEMLQSGKSGDYHKVVTHPVTEQDIKDFYDLYNSYASSEKAYHEMVSGRREAAKELVKKLELLETMSEAIAKGIKRQKGYYKDSARSLNSTNIKDAKKALLVLKQLANSETVQYDIKTIEYLSIDSSDPNGFHTTEEYMGELMILGEKETLSKVEKSKRIPYLTEEMLREICQKGYSVVLSGNDEYMIGRLEVGEIQPIVNYRPLIFYPADDALGNAIISFMKFVDENGSDFEGIESSRLAQEIKDTPKQKVKV